MTKKIEKVESQDTLNQEFRPTCLGDIIGQDGVVIPLLNSIVSDRIPNSIILQGEKGLGKTTTGRAYIYTINCENIDKIKAPFVNVKTSTKEEHEKHIEELKKHIRPCGECDTCKEFQKDPQFAGLTEVDAGSEGKVDEVRNLKESLKYTIGNNYKGVLIDEAHNMSDGGNTALLKVVEEPPKHVIFMFATTHPDSILNTIKSRSLILKFKGVDDELIEDRLRFICDKKSIDISNDALKAIASSTNGGVRDAIKNLEHATLTCLNRRIELSDLKDIVEVEPEYVSEVMDLMFNGDITSLIQTLKATLSSRKIAIENSHLDYFISKIRTKMYEAKDKSERALLREIYKVFISEKERFMYNVPAGVVIEAAVLEAFDLIEDFKSIENSKSNTLVNNTQTGNINNTLASNDSITFTKTKAFLDIFKLIFDRRTYELSFNNTDLVYVDENNSIYFYVDSIERYNHLKSVLTTSEAQGIKPIINIDGFMIKIKEVN